MTKIYRRNKKTVWDFFGNECARCGCTHNLQLDHIDPKTKKFDVSQKLGGRLGPLWEEIRKCQLLCEPCHKQKTKEDQKIISILMGDEVAPRREFITSNALDVANLDI